MTGKRTLFSSLAVLCFALLAAVTVSFAAISTEDFVMKASIANKFEIDTSKLALDRTKNPDVKKFAQMMVDDHMKAGSKLKSALESTKTSAKIETSLDEEHQNLYDTLKEASDDAFDRQYVALQTDAHRSAVSLFSDYSANGTDAVLKKFATDTLPTLKTHLEQVQKINLTEKGA